jgi:hypothetical protein
LSAAVCVLQAGPVVTLRFHLSPHTATFFIQDNLVYSRLLDLEPGGIYRQIDVDRSASAETDRGTWEQDAHGAVLLHPARGSLRFRALTSGPLTIVLDRPGVLEMLPALAGAIRHFLAGTEDEVLASKDVAEILAAAGALGAPPASALAIDPKAETFSRPDLISLAHQIDDLIWSERTNTYILAPVPNAAPPLLALMDARFQAQDLPAVRQEYRIKPGDAPPFYFARVDARTFARQAGRWQVLVLPGQPN